MHHIHGIPAYYMSFDFSFSCELKGQKMPQECLENDVSSNRKEQQ